MADVQARFGDKVNAVSNMIAQIGGDPAEQFAMACVLVEIYRNNLNRYVEVLPNPATAEASNEGNANAKVGT